MITIFCTLLAYALADYRVYNQDEMLGIINRIVMVESGSNERALNTNEYSVGLMGITKIARVEFNDWTGRDYNYWTMFNGDSNREVGSYYLTNITLRYRCAWNVVQAVGAYNAGISNIQHAGIYPADYLEAVIPWYWQKYLAQHRIVKKWRSSVSGAVLVQLVNGDGKPPRMGL